MLRADGIILRIDSETSLYALIGDPVEHSFSPLMQNAAFEALGLNSVYLAIKVKPLDLKAVVEGVKGLGIPGFNVTIPHKIKIMGLLDDVDPRASKIGAINTVYNDGGRLIGYNTDGAGALEALREVDEDPDGKKVTMLGAGGAARALAFYIAPLARAVVILNRTKGKAIRLAKNIETLLDVNVEGRELTEQALIDELKDSDILINTTPVGMYPDVDSTPVDREHLNSNLTVFDIVYNPPGTRLIEEAEREGCKCINGIKMLVYQGAMSFEIWTKMKAPVREMFKAIESRLRVR